MAESGHSAFAEPMSMQEALSRFETLNQEAEDTPDEEEAAPQEADEEEVLAEADAEEETDETEAPESEEEESDQVLTVDEYGDVLVDLNGEPTPLSEIHKGYLRQADYTRKSQQREQEFKQRLEQLEAQQKEIDAREQQLSQLMEEEAEPDWVQLAKEDPLGWAETFSEWTKKQAQKKEQQEERAKRQEAHRRAIVAKTAEIAVEKFPEWSNAKAFDAGATARRDAALAAGFTAQEYESTPDFRIAVLLEKAARWDALQNEQGKKRVSAEKKIAKAPKVLKPGQSRGDSDPEAERKVARQKRFSKPISSTDIKGMLGRR